MGSSSSKSPFLIRGGDPWSISMKAELLSVVLLLRRLLRKVMTTGGSLGVEAQEVIP